MRWDVSLPICCIHHHHHHTHARTAGQRDVDALLEPAAQGLVQVPRRVGRRQDNHRLAPGRLTILLLPSAFPRLVPQPAVIVAAAAAAATRGGGGGGLAHTVHLDHELRLDAAARLVLPRGPAAAGDGVDLVEEDGLCVCFGACVCGAAGCCRRVASSSPCPCPCPGPSLSICLDAAAFLCCLLTLLTEGA